MTSRWGGGGQEVENESVVTMVIAMTVAPPSGLVGDLRDLLQHLLRLKLLQRQQRQT